MLIKYVFISRKCDNVNQYFYNNSGNPEGCFNFYIKFKVMLCETTVGKQLLYVLREVSAGKQM